MTPLSSGPSHASESRLPVFVRDTLCFLFFVSTKASKIVYNLYFYTHFSKRHPIILVLIFYLQQYIYIYKSKGKDKVLPITGHEGPEGEQMYSSTLPSTSALGGQRHAPAALPPGKTRYPLYRGLGGPQGHSGRARNI